jgi:uncharacterized protein YjbI with pentapeptide repeats
LIISCSQSTDSEEEFIRYKYDLKNGNCINSIGDIGFNEFNLEEIRGTKNAECYDLSNVKLVFLKDSVTEETEFFGHQLIGWNFKGAIMDTAQIHFADIIDADFRGTKLSKLLYGYSFLSGRIDDFTELPLEICTIKPDSMYCYN